jgi:hypothetical protein
VDREAHRAFVLEISGHALEARGEIQQINLGYLEIGIPAPSA